MAELSQEELASRLTLITLASEYPFMKSNKLCDSNITIIEMLNKSTSPLLLTEMKNQMDVKFPDAVRAVLKSGGEFCHVCESDEVNLHIQVHLRRYQPEIEGLQSD